MLVGSWQSEIVSNELQEQFIDLRRLRAAAHVVLKVVEDAVVVRNLPQHSDGSTAARGASTPGRVEGSKTREFARSAKVPIGTGRDAAT